MHEQKGGRGVGVATILILAVALASSCYPSDARITGAGNYSVGDDAPHQAERGKSKMKGWGSQCDETEECDAYALNCARHICTFSCTTNDDCAKVGGRCVVRYEHSSFQSEKVCAPR